MGLPVGVCAALTIHLCSFLSSAGPEQKKQLSFQRAKWKELNQDKTSGSLSDDFTFRRFLHGLWGHYLSLYFGDYTDCCMKWPSLGLRGVWCPSLAVSPSHMDALCSFSFCFHAEFSNARVPLVLLLLALRLWLGFLSTSSSARCSCLWKMLIMSFRTKHSG